MHRSITAKVSAPQQNLSQPLQHLGDNGRFNFLTTVLNNSNQTIILADANGNISYCSPVGVHHLGYRSSELIGKHLSFLLPDLDLKSLEIFPITRGSGEVLTVTSNCQCQDDTQFLAEVVFTTIAAEAADYLAIQITEMNTEKLTLQRLVESEAKYRLLVESAPVCIHEISLEGALMSMNTAGLTMLDSPSEAVCGVPYLNFVDESSRKHVGRLLEKAIAGESSDFEFAVDGPDGKLHFSSCFVPIRANTGDVVRLMGITEDITSRLEAEAQRLKSEQQMLHAQKLESLGVLSGGIAHDFNNLLMVILGNASLASEETRDEEVLSYLKSIDTTATRAADLCKQLLAYTGKGKFEIRASHLSQLVEDMQQILSISVAKNVVLRQELSATLPSVEVDRTQISQIIMNLVINGSDAIGDNSGTVTISTGVMELSESSRETLLINHSVEPGQYVYLEVSDSGSGLTKAAKERMFDPFYSTKETGRGLGLAATMGIVKAHLGAINCYSEVGEGTSIKILLPASDKNAEMLGAVDVGSHQWRGSGLILVVEDEKSVQEIATRMLQQMGYEVITADHGLQALDLFEGRQQEIDLILLDMVMPQLDGKETMQRLRHLNSSVPILLTSGYNEYESTSLLAGQGPAGFIQKPYDLNTLRKSVRTILAPETKN